MDPFEEIRYLGWNLEEVEDFEVSSLSAMVERIKTYGGKYSPSHSTLSKRLTKTLYLAEGRSNENGISLPVADAAVEVFHEVSGSPLRKISPRHVANLSKRSGAAPCTLLLAMIYARRMKTTNETYVENMTSADMLLVSMMVASKFLYDEGEDEEMFSDEWAKAANVDLDHVYELEREFLSGMDWKLFVHGEEFFHFIRQIETRIALSQGLGRGWFSYSDMEVLMAHPSWNESWGILFHQALKVLGLCLAVYTVCATSVIWASVLLHHPHLQSPSGCSFLPLTLNSHVKKSTLMHHNAELINTLPSSSTVCHCPSKETNESFDVTETEIEESDCIEENPSVTDLTITLREKYHGAQQALFVFYHALLTAVSDLSVSDGFQSDCNDRSFSSEENSSCVCTCYRNAAVCTNDDSLDSIYRQRSSIKQSSVPVACRCPCQYQNVEGHRLTGSNETETNLTDYGATDLWSAISNWWYELWMGIKGCQGMGIKGESFCAWSSPSLKNRFVDLEMRFGTSSY